jgi:hypothetical protein
MAETIPLGSLFVHSINHILFCRFKTGIYLFSILAMKKFISQLTLFALMTILFIGGGNLVTAMLIKKKASFKLADNIDKVIIGHSHPESAYNDSLITGMLNIAQSGESYFYSYYKTRELIKQNPNLRYIFLEFSNNQLEEERDTWIWGEETIAFRYPTYSPFLDKEGFRLLLRKDPGGILNLQVKSLMKNAKAVAAKNYNYLKKTGEYVHLVRDKIDSLLSAAANTKKAASPTNKLADYNLNYLDKIIALCKKQNVALFLIRSPMHQQVFNSVDEQTFKQVRTTRFNSVEFLDFKNFPLTNHEFGDFSHLNYRGAKKYSLFLNDLLEKGLLLNPNKQQFIDNAINKWSDTIQNSTSN